jgi:primosomal protein N'
MDRDTQKGKSGHQKLLEKFENQDLQILVGTQMVSKGLDFKNIGFGRCGECRSAITQSRLQGS